MKGTFLMAMLVVFCMFVIPLSALKNPTSDVIPTTNTQSNIPYENSVNTNFEKIKVLKDGEILEYNIKEYLFGVLAAEMPALYEEEALKAQAVVARTFTVKTMKSGNKHENNAICTDSACCQNYYDPELYLSNGGTKENLDKFNSAVEETEEAAE